MADPIYNQYDIPKDRLRYGLRSSASTGCGWIATYNALALMGYRIEPEDLIDYYKRQFPLVHGVAGTTLWGPAIYMKQEGFPTKIHTIREEFDEAGKKADACILFYHWHKGAKFGAHFIAVQYRDGRFWGYNIFRNSNGPVDCGESIEAFLEKHRFYGAVLFAIDATTKGRGCRIRPFR